MTSDVANSGLSRTGHVDTFARDLLPSPDTWPVLCLDRPEFQYAERLNCATALLDDAVLSGHQSRFAFHSSAGSMTYAELLDAANRMANVLVHDLGVVPGNRVLLRGANCPMLATAWLAVMKVGGIAVTTMPMLRSKELGQIVQKARIDHAICDASLSEELEAMTRETGRPAHCITWGDGLLEDCMGRHAPSFDNVDTAIDDVCVIAFTSGTTGDPKATMHFHRDIMIMADVVGGHLLGATPDDVFVGSPPLGFTFGLGALLVIPLRFRASAVLIEKPSADSLLQAVERFLGTCLFTAPTMYRQLATRAHQYRLGSLTRPVSAGEPLPVGTAEAWFAATGTRLIDGLGATELTHIFISATGEEARPGAIGRPLLGYQAAVLDDDGNTLPAGRAGRLAVRGPTGCRYLDDPRQTQYVVNGWNVTGDRCVVDNDGYFWFQARSDDMIISAGYNIAGPEVEAALLTHPAVREAAVVGAPDPERGQIVKAFVVLQAGFSPDPILAIQLQEFVKTTIAPYKYPRSVVFLSELPKTATGKIQRQSLRTT